jgi:hypothetical protein
MKNKDTVRIEKIAATIPAVVPSGNWNDWKMGMVNEGSLPVDYWIEGILVNDIKVGTHIFAGRRVRNGERVDGIFVSTDVTDIVPEQNGHLVITTNSIYRVSKIG